jgi:hypothetical protein
MLQGRSDGQGGSTLTGWAAPFCLDPGYPAARIALAGTP